MCWLCTLETIISDHVTALLDVLKSGKPVPELEQFNENYRFCNYLVGIIMRDTYSKVSKIPSKNNQHGYQ